MPYMMSAIVLVTRQMTTFAMVMSMSGETLDVVEVMTVSEMIDVRLVVWFAGLVSKTSGRQGCMRNRL